MSTTKKQRVQLAFIAKVKTKQEIERRARASGRSQGQVVEELVEKAIAYEDLVNTFGRALEDIQRENFETALQRAGYLPVRFVDGRKAWVHEPEAGEDIDDIP
jgi:hypothetical protein